MQPAEYSTDSRKMNMMGRYFGDRVWGIFSIVSILFVFFPVISSSQAPLHPDRGVGLIWYGSQDNLDGRGGIVTIGQVMMMWRDFEPAEGAFNFGPIDDALAKAKAKGMKITVQINGNFHPDYIFETVPYLKGVALNGQKDHTIGFGPPMYWHQDYKEKYTAMVTALAQHLLDSPHRNAILGIRQSYCAVGTENYYLAPEYRDQSSWTIHESATWGGPWPWTSQLGYAYKTWAIGLFVDQFYPPDSINVFMRASAISDGVASAEHVRMVEEGKLWIFHTSSEPQPRNGDKNNQYQQFVNYCKSGRTYGFMESWSKATTSSTGWDWEKTAKPIDLTQFNYWTLLCDLHCGATFPAMRPEDVDFAPFRSDYEFAAKYAGYIASPDSTPGAWIAFREGDYLKGDYTFLMQRDPVYPSQALYNIDNDRRGLWARKVPSDGTMRVTMDPDFSRSLAGTGNVGLNIWYRDEGTGYFETEAFGQVFRCDLEDSRKWKKFGRELVAPVDNPEIRILTKEGPLTLHMVEVVRGCSELTDTSYLLTVGTDGTPGALVQPRGSFLVNRDSSTNLSVTTIPEGYRFSRWSIIEGDADITDPASDHTTVRLSTGSANVEAQFVPALHTLSTSVMGSGRIIVEPGLESYTYGVHVILQAEPDPGWIFSEWTGDVSDTAATIELDIVSDISLTAHFRQDTTGQGTGLGQGSGMDSNQVRMWHDTANRRVIFGFDRIMPFIHYRVYRLNGSLVRERLVDHRERIEVDLSGLGSGMHLVRLSFGGDYPDLFRFIVQPG